MPNSRRYSELKIELNRLRRHFLPKNFNPTGTYSQRIFDRARAYRVLAHAEIEYFIENVILDKVDNRFNEWNGSDTPSFVIICLVAAAKFGFMDDETEELDTQTQNVTKVKIKKEDDSINELIKRCVVIFRDIVKNNNGVKKINIKRLIMPIGIAMSDLDNVWLTSMESFGGKRGAFAHGSRLGITNLPDPKTEKDTIDNLLTGLKKLDELILLL